MLETFDVEVFGDVDLYSLTSRGQLLNIKEDRINGNTIPNFADDS